MCEECGSESGWRKKADTPNGVNEAKLKLRIQEITGIANRGREGLGLNPKKYYSTSSKKKKEQ